MAANEFTGEPGDVPEPAAPGLPATRERAAPLRDETPTDPPVLHGRDESAGARPGDRAARASVAAGTGVATGTASVAARLGADARVAKRSGSDGGAASRRLFAIDAQPRLVALATTTAGRVALFAVFGVLLAFAIPARAVPVVLAGAAGATFLRERRDQAVLLATVAALLLDPVWYTSDRFEAYLATLGAGGPWSARNVQRVLTVVLFAVSALALKYVAARPNSFFARRPVISLLGLVAFATGIGLVLSAFSITSLWLVVSIKLLAAYMWFLCYGVADQRSKQRGSLTFALGLFRPFWGSSSTPIGKGAGYLSKLRSEEPTELARVQLKGLKLLVWSFVLRAVSIALSAAFLAAGVPPLEQIVQSFAAGTPNPIWLGWSAMILAVAIGTLELAIWGHRIVACARLAGFHLRRNTWRPLESRSLADFWNRYYYYFKELLLDFFFYPTFFRAFKKRPRLRTFCATFMAAGVGNAIYHFVRDIDAMFSLGPALAIQGYGSYVFYCVTLASGIAISQVRTGGASATRKPTLGSRAWSFACVWGFVVCIHVFGGIEDRTLPFMTRVAFSLHQFGIGT
jgi:hypothetical protein